MTRALALLVAMSLTSAAGAADAKQPPIVGRWDLTVQGKDGAYPSWLEFKISGRNSLVGSYVGQFGSARPVSKVDVNKNTYSFVVPPQWERRETDVPFSFQVEGDVLRGTTTDEAGNTLHWQGSRAPKLDREERNSWGKPIELFNGRDLTGWQARHPEQKHGWKVRDGILVNAEPGNDLRTTQTFGDFQLHAEFRYPKGSNSGIYLRGRYEVQIEDNFGDEPESHKIGGVYGFLTPSDNASKPAGEWQTVDVTLVGRRVTVVLNGQRVIDRQQIPGPTGGALDSKEGEPGPILIQGDHGPVEFRSLRITPAAE